MLSDAKEICRRFPADLLGISCYNGFRSGLLPRIQCLSRSVTALSQRVYGRAARGGVYGVYLLAEDPDFLYYYQYAAKGRGVYGLIGRKHITSVLPVREKAAEPPAQTVGRSFFCGAPSRSRSPSGRGFCGDCSTSGMTPTAAS